MQIAAHDQENDVTAETGVNDGFDRIAQKLAATFEEGDARKAAAALGEFARSQSVMSRISRETGLSRENLYRSLRGERVPNLHTVMKVMQALGLRLSVKPMRETDY